MLTWDFSNTRPLVRIPCPPFAVSPPRTHWCFSQQNFSVHSLWTSNRHESVQTEVETFEVKLNQEGLKGLLELEFDAAIMEPTGDHFWRLWAEKNVQFGRELRSVGHWKVSAYRNGWKIFNKTDKNDAIALCSYRIERWKRPEWFLNPSQQKPRQLYLQLENLNRIQNPIVNWLGQQLCHELPEAAERGVNQPWLTPNPPGLWRAISIAILFQL